MDGLSWSTFFSWTHLNVTGLQIINSSSYSHTGLGLEPSFGFSSGCAWNAQPKQCDEHLSLCGLKGICISETQKFFNVWLSYSVADSGPDLLSKLHLCLFTPLSPTPHPCKHSPFSTLHWATTGNLLFLNYTVPNPCSSPAWDALPALVKFSFQSPKQISPPLESPSFSISFVTTTYRTSDGEYIVSYFLILKSLCPLPKVALHALHYIWFLPCSELRCMPLLALEPRTDYVFNSGLLNSIG